MALKILSFLSFDSFITSSETPCALYINIECSNELENYEKINIKNSIIKNSIKYIQLDEIDSKLYITSNFISVILSDMSSYYEELIFCINKS